MSQRPDLTDPLARLILFCGRHFTYLRALCWSAQADPDAVDEALTLIREATDTVHNLSGLGHAASEYISGRASGRALVDQCEGLIRAVSAAEDKQASHQGPRLMTFEWSQARAILEEIKDRIVIVEIDGPDAPTTAEHMRATIDAMQKRYLKGEDK